MKRELGIGYCGLICALCSSNKNCLGCKSGACKGKDTCKCFKCCQEKGFSFCHECDQFPCMDSILIKKRIRLFNLLVKDYGEEHILDCLERNERLGIQYHYPDREIGDYDLTDENEIRRLVLDGKE